MSTLALAFLSGIPALVYQVVWIREIALLAGSQIEAISVVLVAFFGGLAVGARVFGGFVDRFSTPLRIYGFLEVGAGLLAALSFLLLRWLGSSAFATASPGALLALAATILFPVTFLLGGTAPALLRSAVRELSGAARGAGAIVGANTAGSVLGVGAAVLLIPRFGLRATLLGASLVAAAVGLSALAMARGTIRPALAPSPLPATSPRLALVAAAVAGVATLAYEVLAARMAALQLGSSLYAWGAVLALVLVGLAAGNLALGPRAARTSHPLSDLGWIEIAVAVVLGVGLLAIAPPIAMPAVRFTGSALLRVALGVLPAAFLMGGAFPFFVRLGARETNLGSAFGSVSAANTAGGIAGAMIAPFLLLPVLGLGGGTLACAGLNAALGLAFLARAETGRGRGLKLAVAAAALVVASVAGTWPVRTGTPLRVIHVAHGRQASAAVLALGNRRDLIVDGDPEASTLGEALVTEELLALLPLLLHPAPRSFFEVGLGSGITLGMAARFPLERVDCAEIAQSVIGSARFFAPENRNIHDGHDPRVEIVHADGRAYLLSHPGEYDVIVGNTLHPWSLGATGLYSREYFRRLRTALNPGGVAVQWLPFADIGATNFAAIIRTFYSVFPRGSVWWGATNLMLVGSDTPGLRVDDARFESLRGQTGDLLRRLRVETARDFNARRMASAESARAAVGPGLILRDDLPVLEVSGAHPPDESGNGSELALLERLAETGAQEPGIGEGMRFWIQSLRARKLGDVGRAEQLEREAEAEGFAEGSRLRAYRTVAQAGLLREAGQLPRAEREYRRALEEDPEQAEALYGLAAVHIQRNRSEAADSTLARLVHLHPEHAEGWSLLGLLRSRTGDMAGARQAFARALDASPYFSAALGNAGLLAVEAGDRTAARDLLDRLRAISPLGTTTEERALLKALGRAGES